MTINSDNLTELREFFQTIITGFFVSRTVGGPQLSLSDQERSRIMITIPSARVNIIDADSKKLRLATFNAHTYYVIFSGKDRVSTSTVQHQ